MAFPSFEEYTETLQLPLNRVFEDPILCRGSVRKSGLGLPFARSGNFALTYEVTSGGNRYAVRCFHKQSSALQRRYDAISKKLVSLHSANFVDFEFQPNGIRTKSGSFPIVRMGWAEGDSLAEFVEANYKAADRLGRLRDAFRNLARHLSANGIAHGDIQPGNVMVRAGGALQLIDYDGMFVPEIRSLGSAELGQRNFQHPKRASQHFDERLDAFSFAVLDLVLEALGKQPDLWDKTNSDEEGFLVRATDFASPGASNAFSLISRIPGLDGRVRNFAAVCSAPFERMPTLDDFIAGRNIPAVSVTISVSPGISKQAAYISAYDVVDGRDFLACVKHIGDRIELIGKIVQVRRGKTRRGGRPYVHVEFGDFPKDMVCLKIWSESLAKLRDVPDRKWVGQWVSVVGLVEPIYSGRREGRSYRNVPIQITEHSQLRKITETEAKYRLGRSSRPASSTPSASTNQSILQGMTGRSSAGTPARPKGGALPTTSAISRNQQILSNIGATLRPSQSHIQGQTGRSTSGAGALSPTSTQSSASPQSTPASTQTPSASGQETKWVGWALAALIVLIFIGFCSDNSSTTDSASQGPASMANPQRTDVPEVPVNTPLVGKAPLADVELSESPEPVPTRFGSVSVVDNAGRSGHSLRVNGASILSDDRLVLARHVEYADLDVLIGFSKCSGTGLPCAVRYPFWVVLQQGAMPVVKHAKDVPVSLNAGVISVDQSGIHIPLGTWDGQERTMTIAGTGEAVLRSSDGAPEVLTAEACSVAVAALESCAAERDCSSFETSSAGIAYGDMRDINVMFHQTTGFNADKFAAICVSSCEFGLTPSRQLVEREVCSGASPGQWTRTDLAWMTKWARDSLLSNVRN